MGMVEVGNVHAASQIGRKLHRVWLRFGKEEHGDHNYRDESDYDGKSC